MNKHLLTNYNYIEDLTIDKQDGKDYIEIGKEAATKLGMYLGFTYDRPFVLPYGKFSNPYKAISHLALEGFPINLRLKHLSKEDINLIRTLRKKDVKHYWVIVLYIIINKIKNDDVLVKLLKENNLDFHWFKGQIDKPLLGKKVIKCKKTLVNMTNYTAVIRLASELVKLDKINDDDYVLKVLESNVDDFESYLVKTIEEAV